MILLTNVLSIGKKKLSIQLPQGEYLCPTFLLIVGRGEVHLVNLLTKCCFFFVTDLVDLCLERSSSVEDQLSSLLEANKSDELKILKDVADEDLDKTSLTEMPTPKQKISFSDSESPDESKKF